MIISFVVEEVRERVQMNWPDAETGVNPEDQDKSCTVLSNYMDNGKLCLFKIDIDINWDYKMLIVSYHYYLIAPNIDFRKICNDISGTQH